MDTTDFSKSYEPMDIDMSAHSNSEMEISYTVNTPVKKEKGQDGDPVHSNSWVEADPGLENVLLPSPDITQQPAVTNIKKFHIKIQKDTNTQGSNKVKIVCAAFILFLSIIVYKVLDIQCSNEINTEELNKNLSNKLYGQYRAVSSLIEALKVEEKTKMLFFYGGTGVGKTYTASLIMEHVGYHSNVYHYTMPSFIDTFTTDFMIGLTVCKQSIVVIDDLTADMDIKSHIEELVTKIQHLSKNVTMILIYNCAKDLDTQCDTSFSNRLLDNFKHIDAFKMFIKFMPLNEEHLRKCIENELGDRKLDEIEFRRISKNFNVTLDGCKGVYTKMKVLDI